MAEEQTTQKKTENAGSGSMLTWVIVVVIITAGSVGGFGLAQLLGGSDPTLPQDTAQPEPAKEPQTFDQAVDQAADGAPSWFFALDPVIANLDEPGVTRYLRASITLELMPEMTEEKGAPFLESKKLLLRDWLTQYIAGLSLEDVRGTSNLARIKKQVRDQFNELLFPESKPMVKAVYLKEFAVQ